MWPSVWEEPDHIHYLQKDIHTLTHLHKAPHPHHHWGSHLTTSAFNVCTPAMQKSHLVECHLVVFSLTLCYISGEKKISSETQINSYSQRMGVQSALPQRPSNANKPQNLSHRFSFYTSFTFYISARIFLHPLAAHFEKLRMSPPPPYSFSFCVSLSCFCTVNINMSSWQKKLQHIY